MSGKGWLVTVLGVALVAGLPWLYFRAEGTPPVLTAPDELVVGLAGGAFQIGFADEGAGLREVRLVLLQANSESVLAEESLPGTLLVGGGTRRRELAMTLAPERVAALGADARLRVSARDWSLRANLAEREIPIAVDREPPRVEVLSGLTYVRYGGAGAVAYRLSEDAQRDGVEVGDVFFRGYPKPGGAADERVALFAIPADAERELDIHVVAEDAVGNRARVGWAVVPRYRELPRERINLSTRTLERLLPRFGKAVPEEPDALASVFDEINTELRNANERAIREVLRASDASLTLGERLSQMANSKVTSRFGERRTYHFEGEQISGATHYGYDLASTANAPVTAAGEGRVAFAGELGIYGNCILIDHGMGLGTLYGHLSRVEVTEGEAVAQGERLGLSGATGLAGGDHLHFAVLVGGVYVDPIEWWDPKWVKSHIHAIM